MENKKDKLHLSEISLAEAQKFWDQSKQGTLFTNPHFLKLYKYEVTHWLITKGSEKLCVWPIITNEKKEFSAPEFSYYFGPYWSNYIYNISQHSKFKIYIKVYEMFIEKFEKIYKNIKFQTNSENLDVRFYLSKKNDKESDYFYIKPKFSASIKNLKKKDEKSITSNFSELRKRMIKKANNSNLFIKTEDLELDEIIYLYRDTILRKSSNLKTKLLDYNCEKISDLYLISKDSKKIISLNGYRCRDNNKIASVNMLGHANSCSNLILNLSDKNYQNLGITALNMKDSIFISKNMSNSEFDFNGANSLVGSDDKHSYGSEFKLYFEIDQTK